MKNVSTELLIVSHCCKEPNTPKEMELILPNPKRWNLDVLNNLFEVEAINSILKIRVPQVETSYRVILVA